MKIILVNPALPPAIDGIGDYTSRLALQLSESAQIIVLTSHGRAVDPIQGVRIVQCFDADAPSSNRQIIRQVREEMPDWVIIQYNPFAWGRRGFNLHLPHVVRHIGDFTQVAVMFHERFFAPATNWRTALMAGWTRWQYRRLVAAARLSLYSTEPWIADHQRRFPGKPGYHLSVGSNIPLVAGSRAEARRALGIAEGALVLGVFGSAHVSRLLDWVRSAALSLLAQGVDTTLLYIGPNSGAVTKLMKGIPVRCEGALSGEDVSRRFRAMDMYLTPFADGISTRRTSFLTALQHGIATVGTIGESTGALLASRNGQAFLLTPCDSRAAFVAAVQRAVADPDLRSRLEQQAAEVYRDIFSWPHIAGRLMGILQSQSRGGERPVPTM